MARDVWYREYMATSIASSITETLANLEDMGVDLRTKRYQQGSESWESHSLKDLADFLDWNARREFGARFRGVTMVDE